MVAARLGDVDDLNHRARAALRGQGRLGPDQVVLAGRAYARGDEILALRNDYRLGLLNGIRAVINRIDVDRRHLVAVTTRGHRVVIPFDYGAGGHLTHGYATTIHKAQGATVDRCFVLLDETASREHAYTAVSRGRHSNEVFVVADDRRREERHAAEVQPDQLVELRAAVGRSQAQRLALDDLGAGKESQLDKLRRERDELRARLGQGPPDPSSRARPLIDERGRQQSRRNEALLHHNLAEQELDGLGHIGRRTRPTRRRQIEARIESLDAEIVRHDTRVAALDRQLDALAPASARRSAWERQHGVELRRLQDLNQRIELIQRLDQIPLRPVDRGVGRSLGVEL